MRAASLFSGAGGGVLGLSRAGLDVVAAIDLDRDACDTLRANEVDGLIETDIRTFDWSQLGPIDVLLGGPPCQPFSAAGLQWGDSDPRDRIPDFIRAVQDVNPQIFVMENVRGLTFKNHRPYFDAVLELFRELGYVVEWRILNAADYGVPQTRQRVFVVGRRDGIQIEWPVATHNRGESWVTMAEALGWAPSVDNARGNRKTPGGNNFESDRPSWALTEKTRSWWVYSHPATTVAAGASGRIGRPGHKDWSSGGESQFASEAVRVTVAEAAILQDFPVDWIFSGTRSSQFKQIGNACPQRLISAVVGAQVAAMRQVDSVTFDSALRRAWDTPKDDTTVGAMLDPEKTATSYDAHRCFLSADGLTGFAVAPDGDLQSMFNVGPAGRGHVAIELAALEGAKTLDCFEPFLPTYYEAHGWVVDRREDNWTPGGPEVAYMRYSP